MKVERDAGTVVLSGYADNILSDELKEKDIFSELEFVVSKDWAFMMIKKHFPEMSLKTFMREYTWDDTDGWVEEAIKDNVLVGEIRVF